MEREREREREKVVKVLKRDGLSLIYKSKSKVGLDEKVLLFKHHHGFVRITRSLISC